MPNLASLSTMASREELKSNFQEIGLLDEWEGVSEVVKRFRALCARATQLALESALRDDRTLNCEKYTIAAIDRPRDMPCAETILSLAKCHTRTIRS